MKVTGIDAVYYTVKDLDKETAFYTQLLGAEPEMTWPGRLSEWTFSDGNSFGLYQPGTEGSVQNGSAMFAVADVAGAVAEAMKLGVKVHGGSEITDAPTCQMAFGEDPEGNQFILHARKTQ
jgi:predicted enzyme related to lactoylglutathione lyase